MNEEKTYQAKSDRILRIFQLTSFCIANIAAYKSNWHQINGKKELIITLDFWVRANSNFFDVAILDWYKLFADKNGRHHWSKIFMDKNNWECDLLSSTGMTSSDFVGVMSTVKNYRDKYVAHLDNPIQMDYPLIDPLLKSASHLYDSMRNSDEIRRCLAGSYNSSGDLYNEKLNEYKIEVDLRVRSQKAQWFLSNF